MGPASSLPPMVAVVVRPLLALAIAALVGGGLLAAQGYDPIAVFGTLLDGGLDGEANLAVSLQAVTPLIFTGLAVSLAFKAGFWNIGVEGQMLMGALAAGVAGYCVSLPAPLHVAVCMLAAMLAGGLWALVPGVLRTFLKLNELVVCLMLNPLALLLTSWVSSRVLKAPGPTNKLPDVRDSAFLPSLSVYSQVNVGLFLALALVLAIWLFNRFSVRGFEWKILGLNPRFAYYGGVDVRGGTLAVFLASGAIAGLAGAEEVLGVYHAYFDNFSPGYGFDGIAVAMLANYHPFGVLASASLFGVLTSGSSVLQMMTGVSKYLVQVLQYIVVLLLTVDFLAFRWPRPRRRERKT